MPYDYRKKTFVAIGDTLTIECPFSEVCMHMKVAGTVMKATVIDGGNGLPMVQLWREDGSFFSFPITSGEGGLYYDQSEHRYYYHPPLTEEDVCPECKGPIHFRWFSDRLQTMCNNDVCSWHD